MSRLDRAPPHHRGAPPSSLLPLLQREPDAWRANLRQFTRALDDRLPGGLYSLTVTRTITTGALRPKSAALWDQILREAIDAVLAHPADDLPWLWLYSLPKLALHASAGSDPSVKRRLELLLDGDFEAVWQAWADCLRVQTHDHRPPPTTPAAQRSRRQTRTIRLCQQGRLRDASKALTATDDVIPADRVWTERQRLFPPPAATLYPWKRKTSWILGRRPRFSLPLYRRSPLETFTLASVPYPLVKALVRVVSARSIYADYDHLRNNPWPACWTSSWRDTSWV